MPPIPHDQPPDLVEGLVMRGGLPSEEFPDREGVPVKEYGDFPDRKVLFPHEILEPGS